MARVLFCSIGIWTLTKRLRHAGWNWACLNIRLLRQSEYVLIHIVIVNGILMNYAELLSDVGSHTCHTFLG